ncbi:DivIVA domain-containing protein [Sinomonas sp. ASV486]|uniref:DivIVA domain-containing protein n=1 Tax=Sinomonas sp. ASV486 TaxID=3051170 RepID=UPI0027DB726D|nr:DivIVA domain-containing protein [Sinomonas sp. ASV486]MDQ4491082.1 DivIVA domain-containing protein [Sinomonas sp. ASV486]
MSFFLVFLAILLAGGLAWFAVDVARGSSRGNQPEGLAEPPTDLPPVLLPEHPNPEDIDAIRFALAFRGYRMDQVDQVLVRLRDRIGVQAALIEALTAQLKSTRASGIRPGGADGAVHDG